MQLEEKSKRDLDSSQRQKAVLQALKDDFTFYGLCEHAGVNVRDGAYLLENLERDGYDLQPWIVSQWHLIPDDVLNKTRAMEGFEELGVRFVSLITSIYRKRINDKKSRRVICLVTNHSSLLSQCISAPTCSLVLQNSSIVTYNTAYKHFTYGNMRSDENGF
jgi:hypothetical protein